MEQRSCLENLLTGPVLRTRQGARARVAALSIAERWALAWHFGMPTADGEDLARRLHDLNHKKRTRGSGTAGTSGT